MADGDKLIRVDMTKLEASTEPFPKKWDKLGGRALSARVLLEECDATCDPLGPDNILVLAPGVLAGSSAPTSGRLSVGGKSPLTNGCKEANTGGNPGQDLGRLGYRAILVTGQPADREKRWGLVVNDDGVELVDGTQHKFKWNYALCDDLRKDFPKSSFISIGPAGERCLAGASVATTDETGHPARHAGRGGLGAVMGAKCLKFVAVDKGKHGAKAPAKRKEFVSASKTYTKAYREAPQFFEYGTSAVVPVANGLHTFPYKNRTSGQSPDVDTLDGKRIVETFEERGGGMHNCMTGCIVQCSNVVHDAEGNYKTSGLEFETLTLLGANCAIQGWEDVADLDRLCDEVGLDTIETGAAIAVYMDSGGMEWGDASGAKGLLKEIADGTELGQMIGNGAVAVGKGRNHARVPAVRGQSLPAWDPRPLQATGITYATSAQGADHTAGLIINPGLDPAEYARTSQEVQIINAAVDSSGFCQFLQPSLTDVANFYTEYMGEEITPAWVGDMGWQCMKDEWDFNRRAGWKDEDDDLPDVLKNEGVGPDGSMVFAVPKDVIDQAKQQRFEPREALYTTKAAG